MTQMQVQRVLVGVDFEPSSAAALAAAARVAELFGAGVAALHAHTMDVPAYFTGAQMDALEAERQQARARAAAELARFAAQHATPAPAALIEDGPPAEAILRAAPAFDLVVLGTRRLHGARRWWLGSVAEAVVRQAPVPVLVVPADMAGAGLLGHGSTILIAGGGDARVEAWATALADAMAGRVERAGDIARCSADRVAGADLVVVPLPAAPGAEPGFERIAPVLKECLHPVLFIRAADAALQGESS